MAVTVLAAVAALQSGPAALTAPAAAQEEYATPAGGGWQVEGRGYGHGRGLGQWSAQAAALAGWSGERIVNWAYPGTSGSSVGDPAVRVKLSAGGAGLTMRMPASGGALWIKDVATGASLATPLSQYRLTASGQGIHISDAITGAPFAVGASSTATGTVELASADGVHIRNSDGTWTWYRGLLSVEAAGGSLSVINTLRMREYLYGVVPRESPSWFHPQALRAQAFVARSYTLAVARPRERFDICDTTSCQVYGGRAKVSAAGVVTPWETPATSAAVDSTTGWILSHAGAPAFTQFSAGTGGWTRDGGKPYLIAQPDPWSGQAPKDTAHAWQANLQVATLEKSCPAGGTLQRLVVTGRDGRGEWGGRITSLRLDCTTGSASLSGDAAVRLGLKSSWWRIVSQPRPPFGYLDAAASEPGRVRVQGWAADPDEPRVPVGVHVYVDGKFVASDTAAGSRADVAAALPEVGDRHGYDIAVTVPAGRHRVCAWALDTGGGANTTLGCADVITPAGAAAIGYLDSVVAAGPGQVRVIGWAMDPDADTPVPVTLTIDGSATTRHAGVARPDVSAVFPLFSPARGFDETLPAAAGQHQVCASVADPVVPTDLGCLSVSVP